MSPLYLFKCQSTWTWPQSANHQAAWNGQEQCTHNGIPRSRKQSDLARVYPCFLVREETPMDPTAANGQLLKWRYPIEFLIAFDIIFSANAAFIATHES